LLTAEAMEAATVAVMAEEMVAVTVAETAAATAEAMHAW
jgi:hypothetical protein